MLPDDVLLEMFDFYLDEDNLRFIREKELWIALAHVCRRWRSLVFQSPHRLNLQLVCSPYTRVRDTLDIWPPLPLVIRDTYRDHYECDEPQDNTIAALEHNDRVCQIEFRYFTSSELELVTNSAAMQKPFPELTVMLLYMYEGDHGIGPEPILPDSFLAGTAPRLRLLTLGSVPFPGLPKLLLLTPHLVDLELSYIPPSGYIPPEAMATGLSALTNLESLHLSFLSPRPHPAVESRRQTPPPLTRSILPNLTEIIFRGTSEYLEVILSRIDAPRLNKLDITFFNEIMFDTPQLFQFISRRPTLRALEMCRIKFDTVTINVKFRSRTSDFGELRVGIPYPASESQLSFLEQICTLSLPPLSTLEDIYIRVFSYWGPRQQGDVDYTLTCLGLLRPFVGVKNLYLSEVFIRRIAPALQELVGVEVLPTLENIFLEGFQPSGPLHEGIEKFVAARQLTNRSVTVSRWDTEEEEDHWYIS
jgi:F-box-like